MTTPFIPALRDLRRRIGANIHALRLERRLTLSKLARLSGLNSETIDRLEMGKNEVNLEHLVRLAAALRTAPESLVAGGHPRTAEW